jgi:peptidoglycan-associated lipoprotein
VVLGFGVAACTPPAQQQAAPPPAYVAALALRPTTPGGTPPALLRPGTAGDFAARVPAAILFPFDSATLADEGRVILDAQAEWLRTYPEPNVIVEGHADERGSAFYNLDLGLQRAQAVAAYLAARGVHPSRIRVISYGAERPADSGNDEAAWARNRRAVTLVAD